MDQLDTIRKKIIEIIQEKTVVPFSHGEFEAVPVIDQENDHYLVMLVGWDRRHRVHGCLVHIDIADEQILIQRDGTEDGVFTELVEAGISPDRIVLAFRHVSERQMDTVRV